MSRLRRTLSTAVFVSTLAGFGQAQTPIARPTPLLKLPTLKVSSRAVPVTLIDSIVLIEKKRLPPLEVRVRLELVTA